MSIQAPLFNMSGKRLGEVDLPDDVFGVEPNRSVMHQALVRQLANARQGTHSTLTRSEVNRTGKKLYKQKGTGNARHGDRTANIFVGGQAAHGPHPRKYHKDMPRQMRRLALRSALSAKAADAEIVVLDRLNMDVPKTRTMKDLVAQVCGGASTLVVLAEANAPIERSLRNLAHVRYLRAGYLNVRDLLGFDRVLLPMDALDAIVAHLGQLEVAVAMPAPSTDSALEPSRKPASTPEPKPEAAAKPAPSTKLKPASAAKPASAPEPETAAKPARKPRATAAKPAKSEPSDGDATASPDAEEAHNE